MNRIAISGKLYKITASGVSSTDNKYIRFLLATYEPPYKGEVNSKVSLIPCVAYNLRANKIEEMKIGEIISVFGSIYNANATEKTNIRVLDIISLTKENFDNVIDLTESQMNQNYQRRDNNTNFSENQTNQNYQRRENSNNMNQSSNSNFSTNQSNDNRVKANQSNKSYNSEDDSSDIDEILSEF